MGVGRRQKLEVLRQLHGSRKRPHHYRQPEPPSGGPVKPEMVARDAVASAKWDELETLLAMENRLAVTDGPWLTETSLFWANLQRVRAALAAEDTLIDERPDFDGVQTRKMNPLQVEWRQVVALYRGWLMDGGLTPTSRARIKMPERAGETDPVDAFLKRA